VKNHSSLADGLYKAAAAIATNGTLSTSNLTADASGGLNAIKADLDTLNSNLENIHYLDRSNDANALHDSAGANTIYQSVLSANSSNAPSTNPCWFSGFKISDTYGFQRAVDSYTGIEYTRYRWGSAW